MTTPKFMSINDFANHTGLSAYSIRKACKEGKYPHIRQGEGQAPKYLIDVEACLDVIRSATAEGI